MRLKVSAIDGRRVSRVRVTALTDPNGEGITER